jgi:ABC-type bacteriocin/lantibiotic exporter with double-glycine peptidase domain
MNVGFPKTVFRLFFLGGVVLFPCGPSQAAEPKSELSKQAVQLTVPFEKQKTARECGLAAAKMIGGYYDQNMSETQQDWLRTVSKAGDGIMGSELVVSLRSADYDTAVFPGTLDKKETGLYRHLDKRRPLIVMITSKDLKTSHYDVLTGYDPKNSLLLLLDPAMGPVTVASKDFLPAWKRANYFTLLAVPKKLNAPSTPSRK